MRIIPLILLTLLAGGSASAVEGRLTAEGPALTLHLKDGRTLQGEELLGLRLTLATGGGAVELSFDSYEEERTGAGRPVPLYRVTVLDPGTGRRSDLCNADAKGRRLGFALPREEGSFDFTCTSGAQGKCVLLGYRPWERDDARPMAALHQACVHLIRADYGGEGEATTRDGTLIDIYDRFGIQKSDESPDMTFEAAWGTDGAVCVARPRIADAVTLDALSSRYPRLKDRLGPARCTEEAAGAQALIFNRSRP